MHSPRNENDRCLHRGHTRSLTAMAAECGSFFTIALGAIASAALALAKTFALAADGFFTRVAEAEAADAAEETAVAEEIEAADAAEATSAVEATSAAEATSAVETTSASEADIVMSPRGSPPFIFVRVLKSNYHQ